MRKRLQILIEQEGLTSAKFAEILSVQPSTISHLLSGRNKPNFEFISRLLIHFPELNARWLINGVEPMYNEQVTTAVHSTELATESCVVDNHINEDIVENEEFNESTSVNSNPLNDTCEPQDNTPIDIIDEPAVQVPQEVPVTLVTPTPIAEIPIEPKAKNQPPVQPDKNPIAPTASKKASKIFIIYDNGTFAELDRQAE